LHRIYGSNPETFKPSPEAFLRIVHRDDRQVMAAWIRATSDGKPQENLDFRVVWPDGTLRWVRGSVEPVCDAAGKPVGAIGTGQDITESKLAEEAIVASEERYRNIVDKAGDMIQSVAPDGRFLYVNAAWRKALGYSEDDVRSLTLFDIVHPSCRRSCEDHFTKVLSGEPIDFLEAKFIAKDGRVIDLEGSAGLRWDGGKVVATQVIFRDVTERKKLQEEVFRISHDWEETFNTITDMVTVHDKDFNIILANKAAQKSLALPFLEGKHVKCFEYYHGTGCPPKGCPSCVSLVTGKPTVHECYEPHLGRYLEISAIPRVDSANQVVGLIHIVRDITEPKRAEAARERLSVAIEQAGETVMVTDAQGTIQYVNPVFEAVTGYTRAEAVGENPRLLKSGNQDEAFYRELWETISSGHVWKGRLVNRRKDGSLFTEEATISPVRDETGRIVNFVAVKRDITEHIRSSEEKARLEDQLRQAQKVEAFGRADPPASGIQPQANVAAGSIGPQHPAAELRKDARPADRGEHRAGVQAGRGAGARQGRSGPD